MVSDALFMGGSALAASAWLLLALGDRWPRAQRTWCATAVPALLACAYTALFPPLYVHAPGGYASIDELVTLLVSDRRIVVAAWFHYLAFDLLIGWRLVQSARRAGLSIAHRLPALVLTFLFGPTGWLLMQAQIALGRYRRRARPGSEGR